MPSPEQATRGPPPPIQAGLLSAVVVNFNAGDFLGAAVDSLLRQDAAAIEVIVVDNRSADDSLARMAASLPAGAPVRVLAMAANLGFARACNAGIEAAAGDRILLVNPDCRLADGALAALDTALAGDPAAGMAGARLVNPDGSEQRGARRDIPNPWTIFCVLLRLHRLMPDHPRFRSFNRHAEPLPRAPARVPAVSGACMLVRREALAAVGLLDDGFFLHFEDLDWCVRFADAGWQVLFVPDAVVEHAQGVCSASAPVRAEREKHRSLVRFLRKHFAAYYPPSFMLAVAALVAVGFALKLPRLLLRARQAPAAGWRAEPRAEPH